MTKIILFTLSLSFTYISISCSQYTDIEKTLFTKLSPEETGITFENSIPIKGDLKFLDYPFLYNGGGVAIGDINNDGLTDIFFTGNMVSSRLYLNKGNMQFEDITEFAGLSTEHWITGASMIDINNNGFLDIYLSVMGPEYGDPEERTNLLFVNNGDNTFREAAKEYNLDYKGFTTHSVFFDYNRNGYLDVFLLNSSPGAFSRARERAVSLDEAIKDTSSFDKLFRNNGDGTFTDVSREAGILQTVGFGLGVVVQDFNRNGWPDIYVSNDIFPNDVFYINNGDGTFTNRSSEYMKQTSFAGMGIDAGDFNNDGWPDLIQTDMMPEKISERKKMSGGGSYERFATQRKLGYDHYYSKNTLQLNNGIDKNGHLVFSEIGLMAGVAYTDWSWSALFGDLNNSSYKDILITNGFPKAINNYDYLIELIRSSQFGTEPLINHYRDQVFEDLEGIYIPNYLFKNNGGFIFDNVSYEWGFRESGFSYGAAIADLNNNGSLDLVVNNINAPASIYKNNTSELSDNHYLQIKLNGEYPNKRGLGTELILTTGEQKQYIYHTPYRGYMSTMDDRIHFGLGDETHIDTLEVIWSDGRSQILTDLQTNQIFTVYQKFASEKENSTTRLRQKQIFRSLSNKGLEYKHNEKNFVDFSVQPLLPYKLSRQGPPLAVGDVTGNGLDDIYIGGSAGISGTLFIQQEQGNFLKSVHSQVWETDKDFEDWGALFFDANANGLLDLYVSSGGYHFSPASQLLQDRLYINHGDGRFLKDNLALPQMITSTATVEAVDFTGNGQMDLFVGGRLMPRNYPLPARNYLLRNDGGNFIDITEEAAPELLKGGMITDVVWIDYTRNGRMDLVTVGEWMDIEFYENVGNKLMNKTAFTGLPSLQGWWFSIAKGDFTNNGYEDLIVGNLGLNHTFKTSEESKFGMYAADFNSNQSIEIIFTYSNEEKEYPFFGRAMLGKYIPEIYNDYLTFEAFSDVSIDQIFNPDRLNRAARFKVDSFASIFIQNNGDGTFKSLELPEEAQISPINGIVIHDVDGDGHLDLIVAGNIFHSASEIPRVDAGNGLWLKGDGNGNFKSISTFESGFLAPADVKDLAIVNTVDGKAIVVANNEDSLQVFSIKN